MSNGQISWLLRIKHVIWSAFSNDLVAAFLTLSPSCFRHITSIHCRLSHFNSQTRMWADAQRDGRPAEYRWHHLRSYILIPFLVPRHKVWLTPTGRMPCSNAVNIGERTTWTQNELCTWQTSVRGKSPRKMYIWCPGDGQASCKVWLASAERRHCSNEVKTRNALKFPEVPQIRQLISAVSGPKFVILWGHVKEILYCV